MRIVLVYLILSLILSGCLFHSDRVEIFGVDRNSIGKITVTSVSIVNNQLVINGTQLSGVTIVRITGPSGFDETFAIESFSDSNLISNGLQNISFAIGQDYNLMLTNASGTTAYQLNFTLRDGTVTDSKLDSMGMGTGQVLKYNGTSWIPGDLGGLTYAGTWNATDNLPDLDVGGNPGEYYIVETDGFYDLSGGVGTNSWIVGDWAVWNDVEIRWEKIDNAISIQSFNGRSGVVTPLVNDYTWAQINKTTSSVADIADVNTGGIAFDKILKWNGSAWAINDDLEGGGVDSVTTTEITDGTIINDDISGTAAIAQSKIANLTTDLSGKLSLAGGTMTSDIEMGANNITFTTGLVDGVDVSSISTQIATNTTDIAGKEDAIAVGTDTQYWRGDKSWQTLDTDAVTEASNLYYTAAGARADLIEAASLTDEQTTTAPSSDVVFDQLALKQDQIIGSTDLTVNSITSTGQNGVNVSPYGTSAGQTGEFRFYELDANGSNYVGLKSLDTLAGDLIWTLPGADGTNGQVLSTNGTGVLSWVTPSGLGTVTNVTATLPLSSTLGMTPNITIALANTTTDGYLSSTDWNTFNNKQSTITTSTTAQYLRGDLSLSTFATDAIGSALTGFVSGAGAVSAADTVLTAINKLDGNIAATEPTLTTGDLSEATSSVLTITGGTGAVIGAGSTIEVKQATTSTSGYLSDTDWDTFNDKQADLGNPVTGTGTSTQIAYFDGTTTQTSSSNLTFDGSNLIVGGDLKLSDNAATCDGGNEGRQRYNSTYKNMQFCDGTYWREVGKPYWASSEGCVPAENTTYDDMVPVGNYCVDKYEASVWDTRAAEPADNQYFSDGEIGNTYVPNAGNLPSPNYFYRDGRGSTVVYAISRQNALPARGITWYQASVACANSGKELIPDHIWQIAVLGTVDPGAGAGSETGGTDGGSTSDAVAARCNINDHGTFDPSWTENDVGVRVANRAGATAGGTDACISRFGVHDMIGNVWEWTSMNGAQAGKDSDGFAEGDEQTVGNPFTYTDSSWNIESRTYGCNGPDIARGTCGWKNNVPAAALRGGSWKDSTAAGAFALVLFHSGSYSDWTKGFRCARRR